MKYCLLPCATCPWRVERDATTIPNFDLKKAEALTNTVGPDDAFRPIMACHGSDDEMPTACLGYLARAGWSNLNVRLLLARGQIQNPDRVADACYDHYVELEPDYEMVLEKLRRSVECEE